MQDELVEKIEAELTANGVPFKRAPRVIPRKVSRWMRDFPIPFPILFVLILAAVALAVRVGGA